MKTAQTLNPDQLQQLRDLLKARCGIKTGDACHQSVDEGIARLMLRLKADSFEEFFAKAADPQSGVRDQLANAMLSRETWWFRDSEGLRALSDHLLPEREEGLLSDGGEKIRIWSAGCSTGQEPYSLVMALLDRMWGTAVDMGMPAHYEIIGTDISPAALFLAVAGRYDPRAMESSLPEGYLERYFTRDNLVHSLKDAVRGSVRFRQHNLMDSTDGLASGAFDAVLLRRVLCYYSEPAQKEILGCVAGAMSPGGMLLLGQGEELPENGVFEPASVGDCPCYRRRP
ncbi:MAG: protein-glutamate O-methyltransferase CheR [Candidatus Eisenbacteria sp.]|nr:protein-glutamate O-methyltransferase CheR [Candidatus Eisenbacteria bacterium]